MSMNKYKYFQALIMLIIFETSMVSGDDSSSEIELRAEEYKIILPEDWMSGIIPYALNFFSPNPKRLLGLVKKGIYFLENSSCLRFEEQDPVKAAQLDDYTYLYFTYSGVSEDCCLKYYTKDFGRRTVLITPVCSEAHEVAHATLHGLGITHPVGEGFSESAIVALTEEWCDRFLPLRAKVTRLNKIATSRVPIMKMSSRIAHRFTNLSHWGQRITSNQSKQLRTSFKQSVTTVIVRKTHEKKKHRKNKKKRFVKHLLFEK